MKISSRKASKPGHIICPACGSGELEPQGSHLTVCDACGLSTNGTVLRTLEQIAALPEGLGYHACECGHPEMRHLPDGVFHCPACGLEVLPSEASFAIGKGWLPREAERGIVISSVHTPLRTYDEERIWR